MESIDLREIVQPLRKWWWLLLAAALLAGVSSTFYLLRQPSLYQSRTTLVVGSFIQDPNPSGNDFYLTQQLAANYADLIQRGALRQATMAALAMDWLPDYSAHANAQLLEITVTDVDPQRAQRVAQELATQLIEQSPAGQADQARQGFVNQRLQKMETDILATEGEIERRQAALANELSASKIARMQSDISILSAKVNTLQSTYADLLATTQRGAANAIAVLEAAGLPTQPIDSSFLTNVLVAVIFGLVLAGGSAYLIEYLDDTVRTVEQIKQLSGMPTLGAIPSLGGADATNDEKLIMLHSNLDPKAEAYRVLRTNLEFAAVDHALQTLQVTSPAPGEGKSITAANLSAALAYGGRSVILVDADFRRPMQHKLFKVTNNVGVTSALLGELDSATQFLRETSVPGLRILTSGPLPPNPSELLGSKRMQQLLAALQQATDIVVIDSPPVTAVSDTTIIASRVDGVLLTLKAGQTRREALKHAVHALKQVNAHILGAVLNEVQGNESGYYFNHNARYGYGYKRAGDSGASASRSDGSQHVKNEPKSATNLTA